MSDPLKSLSRERAALTEVFARDLRSPLSAIAGNITFLESGGFEADPEVCAVFEELRVSCDEFLRMVDNVDAIARHGDERGPLPSDLSVDLVAAARDALAAMRPSAAIAQVTLSEESSVQAARVRSPKGLLELLLRNLLSNGITHARRDGWATLTIGIDTEGSPTVVLRDPGPSFGDLAVTFAREQQADVKVAHKGRYARGLNPYLLGVAIKRLGATVRADHDGAQSALTITFPRE